MVEKLGVRELQERVERRGIEADAECIDHYARDDECADHDGERPRVPSARARGTLAAIGHGATL